MQSVLNHVSHLCTSKTHDIVLIGLQLGFECFGMTYIPFCDIKTCTYHVGSESKFTVVVVVVVTRPPTITTTTIIKLKSLLQSLTTAR